MEGSQADDVEVIILSSGSDSMPTQKKSVKQSGK